VYGKKVETLGYFYDTNAIKINLSMSLIDYVRRYVGKWKYIALHTVIFRGVTIDGDIGLDIGFIDHLYTPLGSTSTTAIQHYL
jgi:hypothetical protein